MAPPTPNRDMNEPYIVITCEEAFAQDPVQNPEHTDAIDPLYGPWGEQSMS